VVSVELLVEVPRDTRVGQYLEIAENSALRAFQLGGDGLDVPAAPALDQLQQVERPSQAYGSAGTAVGIGTTSLHREPQLIELGTEAG
jgi:hypothetical protein